MTGSIVTIPDASVWLLVFRIDSHRYALPLSAIERVVRAVAVTPLPNAPALVLGAIDVQGQLLAVLDMRRKFCLPSRRISPADHLVIARATHRTVALLIDTVEGVIERRDIEVLELEGLLAEPADSHGAVRLDDGLVLIARLDRLLSSQEEHELQALLECASAERNGH